MDELIIATPEQQVYISGTYSGEHLSLALSCQHVNNLYTQISPAIETETYTLFHSKIIYTINEFIDIFIKLENLTDRKYYINSGYPMPGITAFGGINLHFSSLPDSHK